MASDILSMSFLHNRVLDYLIFLASFIIGVLIIKTVNKIIMLRLKAWADKTSTTIDDFVISIFEKKLIPLLYFIALYFSLNSLTITDIVQKTVNISVAIILTYFGLRFLISLLNYSLERYWANKDVDKSRQQSLKGIITILKVIVWGAGITFLLDNLGFEISTVVAGLGIGGLAVALAAQSSIANFISGLILLSNKPVRVGDFCRYGEDPSTDWLRIGTIEEINWISTRIRGIDRTVTTIPNA